MRGTKADLVGQRFGKLTVIGEDLGRKRGYSLWHVQCDCGSPIKTVISTNLLSQIHGTKSCGCLTKRLPGQAARNKVLRDYKKNAKKRSLVWGITDEGFDLLTSSNCQYCGIRPSSITYPEDSSNGEFVYNGIDRIDNRLGYIAENVVPCCKKCNWAKGEQSHEDFMTWIASIFQHQSQKWTTDLLVRAQAA